MTFYIAIIVLTKKGAGELMRAMLKSHPGSRDRRATLAIPPCENIIRPRARNVALAQQQQPICQETAIVYFSL